jgi:hypothetical protein
MKKETPAAWAKATRARGSSADAPYTPDLCLSQVWSAWRVDRFLGVEVIRQSADEVRV